MRRFLPFLCLLGGMTLGSLPVAAAPLIAVEIQDGPAGVELPVTIRTAEETPPISFAASVLALIAAMRCFSFWL